MYAIRSYYDYLGVQHYDYGKAEEHNQVGQVVGLAWTEVGGDLLVITSYSIHYTKLYDVGVVLLLPLLIELLGLSYYQYGVLAGMTVYRNNFV